MNLIYRSNNKKSKNKYSNIQDYGKLNFYEGILKIFSVKIITLKSSLVYIFRKNAYIEKYINDININQFVHYDNFRSFI